MERRNLHFRPKKRKKGTDSWVKSASKEATAAADSTAVASPATQIAADEVSEADMQKAMREDFKALLREKQVTTEQEWQQILPKIIYDVRYSRLPTLAKRKSVLKEYQDEIASSEKE
eukprot:1000435_1